MLTGGNSLTMGTGSGHRNQGWSLDLTPFVANAGYGTPEEGLESIEIPLDLLASGLSDREIATRLVVSNETAHTYTKRLLQTLNVHNRLQAVLKGMRCGMVQL